MVFTETFFDRYLLPLIPLLILFFLSITDVRKNLEYLINSSLVIFMVFSIFLSTQMANDFVVSNNYVWGRSENLVKDGVKPESIEATMAWQKLNGLSGSPEFFFSFSGPDTEPNYLENYYLFEEKSLGFKGSVFVNPMVYLYKKK